MRTAMLTAYDKNAEDYALPGIANKIRYCEKQNVPFLCETNVFPPDGAYWGKLLLIIKNLPNYDWLFWTDADSLVMNSEIAFKPPSIGKDLIISYDRYTINNGNFWIRNCPWAYDFLVRAYCSRNNWFFSDNGAFMQLFEDNPDDAKRFEVVSQRLFNSYAHNGTYKKGDFIIHFAGQSNKKELMTTWASLAT